MELQERRPRLTIWVIIILVLLAIALVALYWGSTQQILRETNWSMAFVALLFTAMSYLGFGYGFATVFRVFRVRVRQLYLLEVGFVSTVLDQLVTLVGLAGLSMRLLLMRRLGLKPGEIVPPSIFHSYLNNLGIMIVVLGGLLNTLISFALPPGGVLTVGIAAIILALVITIAATLLFVAKVRVLALRVLAQIVRFVARRDISNALTQFGDALSAAVIVIRNRPWILALLMALVVADWLCNLTTLWLCFKALGYNIHAGVLVTGFAAGVTLGFISLIPGGLGVQEASMAGVYALFQVPFAQAALAAVLFRVVYYFIPFFASLGFYWRWFGNSQTVRG
jgi:uncharacterized protein (TIRG00374 family)